MDLHRYGTKLAYYLKRIDEADFPRQDKAPIRAYIDHCRAQGVRVGRLYKVTWPFTTYDRDSRPVPKLDGGAVRMQARRDALGKPTESPVRSLRILISECTQIVAEMAAPPATVKDALRPLKVMTALNIVLLSLQAWTGDVVNLFASFPQGAVNGLGGAVQGLESAGPGPLAIYHGVEGVVIVLLTVGIVVTAFRRTKSRGVRIASLLALFFIAAAAVGGYYFVFSGFLNNGNSAQMAGSFIGAYAMNFLVLYYSK